MRPLSRELLYQRSYVVADHLTTTSVPQLPSIALESGPLSPVPHSSL